jgi:hypothetical protein
MSYDSVSKKLFVEINLKNLKLRIKIGPNPTMLKFWTFA